MIIGTNGILINELGRILLIQRNDTRTFAPPGGGVEAGELPTDNIVREVREETGLIAMPVRLVSVVFWPMAPNGRLIFTFRMMQRGGELETSPESPQVGFFELEPLPQPMARVHQKRVHHAAYFAKSSAEWWDDKVTIREKALLFTLQNVVYRWYDLRRKLKKQPPFIPAPPWHIETAVIIRNSQGQILWQKDTDFPQKLPSNQVQGIVSPWQSLQSTVQQQIGVDLSLQSLSGVYVKEGQAKLTMAFTAVLPDQIMPDPNRYEWLPADNTPHESDDVYKTAVSDAIAANPLTQFRLYS